MMRHRLLLSVIVFALSVCPAACFGGWLAHEHDSTPPADCGEQRCCVEHSCICGGATVPSSDQAIVAAANLPIAVLPVEDLTDRVSLIVGAYVAAYMPIPDLPESRGVLPLLI